MEKPKTIDDYPTEFLFHYSCGRMIEDLPKLHIGSLIELKEGLEELKSKLDLRLMKEPEEIREAFGMTVIDIEEVEDTNQLSLN